MEVIFFCGYFKKEMDSIYFMALEPLCVLKYSGIF